MNGLDVVLIVAAVLAAIGGWRLGFMTRAVGWIGAGIGIGAAIRSHRTHGGQVETEQLVG